MYVCLGFVRLPEWILGVARVALIIDYDAMAAHLLLTLFVLRFLSFDEPLNLLKQILESRSQWLDTDEL